MLSEKAGKPGDGCLLRRRLGTSETSHPWIRRKEFQILLLKLSLLAESLVKEDVVAGRGGTHQPHAHAVGSVLLG